MIRLKKIHPIYFSSSKHFKYMILSLKSLLKLKSDFVGNIYLYIDEDDYLNEKQINILKKIDESFIIRKTNNITGLGKKYILSELRAFEEVSREIGSDDYVAKTDSDVIFLNDNIFRQTLESDMVLIGYKERFYDKFVYTQGGLYFIKANFISKIINYNHQKIIEHVLSLMNIDLSKTYECPEDVFFYFLIKKHTNKILFLPFMNIPFLRKEKKPSVIHFMNTKKSMKYFSYIGNLSLFFSLFDIFFIKSYYFILIGKIGYFLKSKFPKIYKFLKPYFPDRKNLISK